jgi:hypothetical protein
MKLVQCPTCKGSGKIEIDFFENKQTQKMSLKCYNCDGAKVVTVATLAAINASNLIWCRCKNPGEQIYHPDSGNQKHHWTCSICGKVTQIG